MAETESKQSDFELTSGLIIMRSHTVSIFVLLLALIKEAVLLDHDTNKVKLDSQPKTIIQVQRKLYFILSY